MLCFRCEHRAKFLENGDRPRYECGVVDTSKGACYMYRPCKPVITEPLDKSDPRPDHGGYFGRRMKAVGLYEKQPVVLDLGGGKSTIVYPVSGD